MKTEMLEIIARVEDQGQSVRVENMIKPQRQFGPADATAKGNHRLGGASFRFVVAVWGHVIFLGKI
jgi:hypothetical protein